MASQNHERWFHTFIRLFGSRASRGLGIGIILLFVLFRNDTWWGVKALGFYGFVLLVTYANAFILRVLFRLRGKRFSMMMPTDRSPPLEFLSIMISGCTFVAVALSVVVALGHQPAGGEFVKLTASLVGGVTIGGGTVLFFRRQKAEGDDQPGDGVPEVETF